jgi:ABC-type microcin C transport system permease subunit YejB
MHSFVLIAAVAVTFSAYMVTSLVIGDTHYQYLYAILLPVCFAIGLFFARFTLTFAANAAPTKSLTVVQWIYSIFGVWSFSTITDNGEGHNLCKTVSSEKYF